MIRANLATRPFYNERAVRLWLFGLAIVALAATVFNVVRVITYSQSDTVLATQASRDEAQAANLRGRASQIARERSIPNRSIVRRARPGRRTT